MLVVYTLNSPWNKGHIDAIACEGLFQANWPMPISISIRGKHISSTETTKAIEKLTEMRPIEDEGFMETEREREREQQLLISNLWSLTGVISFYDAEEINIFISEKIAQQDE